MMYPRLKLGRNLLADDGVIFISIDDNEVNNLKKVCDEIFGEENFVAQFNWMKTSTPPSLSKNVRKKLEYVLCFKKLKINGLNGGIIDGGDMPLLNESNDLKVLIFDKNSLNLKIDDGIYKKGKYDRINIKEDFIVKNNSAQNDLVIEGRFKWIQNTLNKEIDKGTIFWVKSKKFAIRYERQDERIKVPSNIISKDECDVGTNEDGKKEILSLFNSHVMDYPKPSSLIKYLINMNVDYDPIILDFFSGSSTTAEAILKLNVQDNKKIKFIMVQLSEQIDKKSEGYKSGYKNIAEIGKERIRRTGEKIKLESDNPNLDIGFKVFKLDSSNLNKWNPDYNDLEQTLINSSENLVHGRTELDLIYEIMLKYGIDLTLAIEEFELKNKKIYSIGFGSLLICLDNNITKEIATEIIKLKEKLSPETTRVVFKDNGFASDSDKTNIKETLKTNNVNEFITI
ncbi:DNA methylase [Methanobrevibacter curvatus]|uniref:DNA methylase n=2 Tax=Methanobrevibacter curvatus TaxID=49547 RepID=A0A165Z1S8_9EURY|nr:DNA methylase [Methanobrevibacter curvatus]